MAVFQVHFIHMIISVVSVLFFTSLNETIKEMIRKNQKLQSEAKDAEIAFFAFPDQAAFPLQRPEFDSRTVQRRTS